jgi:small multidrug resistance family-3 protein
LWLKKSASPWWLIVAAASLALFVWLLTLHSHPAGRVYAAYGGVYIAVSVLWLWLVDGVLPDRWDLVGTAIVLVGVAVIYLAPRDMTL